MDFEKAAAEDADRMRRILEDPEIRAQLIAAGTEYSKNNTVPLSEVIERIHALFDADHSLDT